jgi:hypothetical protein
MLFEIQGYEAHLEGEVIECVSVKLLNQGWEVFILYSGCFPLDSASCVSSVILSKLCFGSFLFLSLFGGETPLHKRIAAE